MKFFNSFLSKTTSILTLPIKALVFSMVSKHGKRLLMVGSLYGYYGNIDPNTDKDKISKQLEILNDELSLTVNNVESMHLPVYLLQNLWAKQTDLNEKIKQCKNIEDAIVFILTRAPFWLKYDKHQMTTDVALILEDCFRDQFKGQAHDYRCQLSYYKLKRMYTL